MLSCKTFELSISQRKIRTAFSRMIQSNFSFAFTSCTPQLTTVSIRLTICTTLGIVMCCAYYIAFSLFMKQNNTDIMLTWYTGCTTKKSATIKNDIHSTLVHAWLHTKTKITFILFFDSATWYLLRLTHP